MYVLSGIDGEGNEVKEIISADDILRIKKSHRSVVYSFKDGDQQTFCIIEDSVFHVAKQVFDYTPECLQEGVKIYEKARKLLLTDYAPEKYWRAGAKYCRYKSIDDYNTFAMLHRELFGNRLQIDNVEDVILTRRSASASYCYKEGERGKRRIRIRCEMVSRHIGTEMICNWCKQHLNDVVDYVWEDFRIAHLLEEIPKEKWKVISFDVYSSGLVMMDLVSEPIEKQIKLTRDVQKDQKE